eukprot:CAMPEP_0197556424 /NCGR_PEP_ID=MMETSP1320-20131121/15131_1 /TAXON_ID=91990 /ORGANISM="Bolidomonas sp., Strain RCC2347" /LENGTH=429 /DNA_ID=CAMNT_0043117555 /DNA_START=52 /DNA_END=1338 /DNA_ORIENTATION=+
MQHALKGLFSHNKPGRREEPLRAKRLSTAPPSPSNKRRLTSPKIKSSPKKKSSSSSTTKPSSSSSSRTTKPSSSSTSLAVVSPARPPPQHKNKKPTGYSWVEGEWRYVFRGVEEIDQSLPFGVVQKLKELLKLRLRRTCPISGSDTYPTSENGLDITSWPTMLEALIEEAEPSLKKRLEAIKETYAHTHGDNPTLRSKVALESILYTTTTTTTSSSSSASPPDMESTHSFTLPKRGTPVRHTFPGWGTHNGVYLEPTTAAQPPNSIFRCLWKDKEDNRWHSAVHTQGRVGGVSLNLTFNQLGRAIENAQVAKWKGWKEDEIAAALTSMAEVEDAEDDVENHAKDGADDDSLDEELETDVEVDHMAQTTPTTSEGSLNTAPSNSFELSYARSEIERLNNRLAFLEEKLKRQARVEEKEKRQAKVIKGQAR